jgi:hypothetical protein
MKDTFESLESINEKINIIQQKIADQKQLISTLQHEKIEWQLKAETLTNLLLEKEEVITANASIMESLKNEMLIAKEAENTLAQEDTKKKELKKALNEMLKEVDKCLAGLSN